MSFLGGRWLVVELLSYLIVELLRRRVVRWPEERGISLGRRLVAFAEGGSVRPYVKVCPVPKYLLLGWFGSELFYDILSYIFRSMLDQGAPSFLFDLCQMS